MDGNTLLTFEQFSALDVRDQYLNYVREYNAKTEIKASLSALEQYGMTRERKVRRGLILPSGFGDLERLDQGLLIVMLRQFEKAKMDNSPDMNNLMYNLREECKSKRVAFDDLKKFTSDDLIYVMLQPLSRVELCKSYALMADLLSEVTPISRITIKTMPLIAPDISPTLDNITINYHEVGQVSETRYHKHSASFASLGELHMLQHMDVMSTELGVYNLGIAGNMFDCMFKDEDGKIMSCSSISNWNSGVSFCSLMPRMSKSDSVHTIVRRLAGLPTVARLCTDPEIEHKPFHVGKTITYILSNYAISSWSIGFDEIGAPTFQFNGMPDTKPIPLSCCARPKPVKAQRRIDNNIGKRHYHTWRMLGDATGNTTTPIDRSNQSRRSKGRRGSRGYQHNFQALNIQSTSATCTAQLLQYEDIRCPDVPNNIYSPPYMHSYVPPSDNLAEFPPLEQNTFENTFNNLSGAVRVMSFAEQRHYN